MFEVGRDKERLIALAEAEAKAEEERKRAREALREATAAVAANTHGASLADIAAAAAELASPVPQVRGRRVPSLSFYHWVWTGALRLNETNCLALEVSPSLLQSVLYSNRLFGPKCCDPSE